MVGGEQKYVQSSWHRNHVIYIYAALQHGRECGTLVPLDGKEVLKKCFEMGGGKKKIF